MTKQAIIHVEDTENVIELAKYLSESGWTIYSANKTEELLKKKSYCCNQRTVPFYSE